MIQYSEEPIIEKRVANFHMPYQNESVEKLSIFDSSVFMYNVYVLNRPHRHLIFVTLIGLH